MQAHSPFVNVRPTISSFHSVLAQKVILCIQAFHSVYDAHVAFLMVCNRIISTMCSTVFYEVCESVY